MKINKDCILPAVLGGAFYGGGGGGSIEMGLALARQAFACGTPQLAEISSLPKEALLATCSMVGAPAAPGLCLTAEDFVRSTVLLEQAFGQGVAGFISNENGAVATVNGWVQSAARGLPVVDAPANGRAHPTGVMGAMGLNARPGYVAYQAACGGSREQDEYMELTVSGGLEHTSALVRCLSQQAGGMVAVCRNPVSAAYVESNGAPGAIGMAINMGSIIADYWGQADPEGPAAMAEEAKGYVLDSGIVAEKVLDTRGGFDVGSITIHSSGNIYTLPFWNEYLSVKGDRDILAAFPDLLALINEENNEPLTSARIQPGQRVTIVVVPSAQLKLGRGMFIEKNLAEVKSIIQAG